ncbi:hypothetical protein [Pontiella sp.]|uniref:hypothetical protein n=1 Tax=Pontiella sp. TaxID=2837462 RepID=UPI0035659B20
MKRILVQLFSLAVLTAAATAQKNEPHTFSNAEGQTLEDRILKYDFEGKQVTLEKKGRVPLKSFSPEDQEYIIRWNQVQGFQSTMNFKMAVRKRTWGQLKYEQTITPYYMDAVQVAGKKTPNHKIIMIDDYEEYSAVLLEADGFEISFRNQNSFPIENLVVESKVFYEQEIYAMPDSLLISSQNVYTDVTTTNKVRFLSETIPIIIPREEITMYSECAIVANHQLDRSVLVSTSTEESEDGEEDEDDLEDDEEEDEEEAEAIEEATETIEGFGDWDDHSRQRKGKVIGAWFRVGIKADNGEMVWRELTEPSSLSKKVSWGSSVEPDTSKTVNLFPGK